MTIDPKVPESVQRAREELARRSLSESLFDGTEKVVHDALIVATSNWVAKLDGGRTFCVVCGENRSDVNAFRCTEHQQYRIVWIHHSDVGTDFQRSVCKQLHEIAGLELQDPWQRCVPTDVDGQLARLYWWARLKRGFRPCAVCGKDALWYWDTDGASTSDSKRHEWYCDQHAPKQN